ncbi:hypothetical protein C6P74_25615 [Burkholderia multivorans]|uniref:hypothetical protein n=1 Tax=Burkholderia multivorans TaxID=87883 RepID=UPI000CFF2819|nr:hypothetical protein [Burkholderia multivorans]MBU9574069.1 hypothetical protein [Burkholderia multivorans]MDN7963964.1 hypothetical protein [Burkholderia multivorans]PRD74951.1 hypothetical protein C6P74_25615 [Burkholderia multivorans]
MSLTLELLSSVLARQAPGQLDRARSIVRDYDRKKLATMYDRSLTTGQRAKAFLLAEALTAHGLPPCFRLDGSHGAARFADTQRFDLLAHDLQWIMATYPEHWRKAMGGYSGMLHGASWLSVAEHYWSTKNQRDTWLMVRQLALTVDQQWECAVLRSAPIKRAAQGLAVRQMSVHKAIMDRLSEANRAARGRYPLAPAYERRFKIWVCGEMTGGSPTKTARLYEFWTGSAITRSVAHTDLEWVRACVPKSRKGRDGKTGKRDMHSRPHADSGNL